MVMLARLTLYINAVWEYCVIDPEGNIAFYFPHKIREMCPWAKLLLAEGFPLVLICYLDKQGLYI